MFRSIYAEDEEKEKKQGLGYDKESLLKTRVITLFSEINRESSSDIVNKLVILDNADSSKAIWLYINSPGGDVDSGFAIYDMIRFVKAPVYILGCGMVASAAALIYCAVAKERRFALLHSSYLIHQPLAKMDGNAIDVEIYAKKLQEVKFLINKILAEASQKTIEEVAKDTDRDYTMTSLQAREYGLVGKIVSNFSELQLN